MASAIRKIMTYNADMSQPLRELKLRALAESPFRFFRGTCHLFADDFVKLYKYKPKTTCWMCGDLHLENFGSYKAENRLVYFDLNDFDEAILAGPEPELCRFLAAFIIAAGAMKPAGAIGLHKALHDIMETYITTIQARKALMLEEGVAHGVFRKYFHHLGAFDREAFIAKRTEKVKGALLLREDSEHLMHLDSARKAQIYRGLQPLLKVKRFEHLVFEDAAFRIVGTGSLGLNRFCVLCYSKRKGKRYLLDVKESRQSCYTGQIKVKQPTFRNEADRILQVGNIMQFNSPAFTAPAYIDGKWYVVKEMQMIEDKLAVAGLGADFGTLSAVGRQMAVLTAYAQIRSSGHMGSDTADDLKRIADKKQWQKDIIELSAEMARRNTKNYRDFTKQ